MNKFSNQFDWNHARAFLATAQSGSLSRAAKMLRQSQPTIGRQITALEEALGILLFDRVGQRLVLTEKGRALLQYVEEMNRSADQLSIIAERDAESVEGHVSITISDNFAAMFMPYVLRRAREIAPKITVDVHAQNNVEDLARREADIALRHMRPSQNDLIAKRLSNLPARLYGAKNYLDTVGRPRSITEAEKLEMVAFGRVDEYFVQAQAYGVPVLPKNARYGSENGIVAWEMAKAGLGLIYMADDIAAETQTMEAVLPQETEIEFPIWLVTHRELHTNKRIRMIFDLMAECFVNPRAFLRSVRD